MRNPLDGVKEKISRAEAHLVAATAEIELHKNQCTILAKKQGNRDFIYDLYANFPAPGFRLSCVISDCLHNLRAALDYVVYELAFREDKPPIHNMFPICNTSIEFNRQIAERDRLRNVPQSAREIIERLQPYKGKGGGAGRFSHPLYILHKLIKADKHRMLPLTMICGPQPTLVLNEPSGQYNLEAINITHSLSNNAFVPDQRIEKVVAERVTLHIQHGLYVSFEDLHLPDSPADSVLSNIIRFIKGRVVPSFEPFFNQSSKRSASVAAK
jgi:hypothetical protein